MTGQEKTLVRENPIPMGRYWQDLIGPVQKASWQGWVKGLNRDYPHVHVETTEDYESTDGAPSRTFVIYTVLMPVVWNHVLLGTPNVAPDWIHTSDDTVQKPPPESSDPFGGLSDTVKTVGFVVGGAGVFLGLAYVAGKFIGGGRK
jgi:hypothetical protein